MPTYQYACTDCGDRTEVVQRFADDSLSVCTACGGRLRKVFSPVGIVFKGSGFYRTDSRSGSMVPADGGSKDGSAKDGSAKDGSASKNGSAKDGGSGSKSSGSESSSSSSSSNGSSDSGSSSSGSSGDKKAASSSGSKVA